jgi:hypothetical protein
VLDDSPRKEMFKPSDLKKNEIKENKKKEVAKPTNLQV